MSEKITPKDVEALVAGLSYQDKERILCNILWDVFGDVDEDGDDVIVPGRGPDEIDVESLRASLAQEFWPGSEGLDYETVLSRVKDHAERLVAAGDLDSFEDAFGSRDPDFDVSALDEDDARYVYDNYVADED